MNNRLRTMLYCPANNPTYYFSAKYYRPDGIIFDLEDSIAIADKDAARHLLIEGLGTFDFEEVAIFVRINGVHTPFFKEDVKAVVKAGAKAIRLPMCESADEIKILDSYLAELEIEAGIVQGCIKIQAGIETPKGVIKAVEIVEASPRIMGLSFGAEDYTASLGISRTKTGEELLYARSHLVNVAKAYSLEMTDSVWSDVDDLEGFKKEVAHIKQLGFKSKACIHPNQIEIVHDIMKPNLDEVCTAKKIIDAVEKAAIDQGGVIALEGKMIDVPVIKKAKQIIAMSEGITYE